MEVIISFFSNNLGKTKVLGYPDIYVFTYLNIKHILVCINIMEYLVIRMKFERYNTYS